MNATIAHLQPLPSALQPRLAGRPCRRRLVGDFPLEAARLDRFNRVLTQLRHAPLDCDQLASAARQLAPRPGPGQQPDCIEQRLQGATTIGRMVTDRGWRPANEAIDCARLVVDYVGSDHDLIPDRLPAVGRLDDAIVIDAAWPQLATEVARYLDYCRVRSLEAELRGCNVSQFAFGRDDWEQVRRAEASWIAHCRAVNARSYLPRPQAYFRVC